ncbi:MAG: signal peptide peptidase SppA, partial [Nitrospirota bacterium]|nr:signal peptide peptidase SppA [Nitrospirota bacterium]
MKKFFMVLLGLLILLVIVSILLIMMQKSIFLGDRIALVRIEGMIADSKNSIEEIKKYVKDPS